MPGKTMMQGIGNATRTNYLAFCTHLGPVGYEFNLGAPDHFRPS
jgi:hypothetical protein